jgi:hypothetical protein
MMKILYGVFIGIILAAGINVYALRSYTPPVLTNLEDRTQLVNLNNYLTEVQNIVNGRYNFDVDAAVPTGTAATEGLAKVTSVAGTYRLYIYVNGAWRYATLN